VPWLFDVLDVVMMCDVQRIEKNRASSHCGDLRVVRFLSKVIENELIFLVSLYHPQAMGCEGSIERFKCRIG
jgi:hypothetical protein